MVETDGNVQRVVALSRQALDRANSNADDNIVSTSDIDSVIAEAEAITAEAAQTPDLVLA